MVYNTTTLPSITSLVPNVDELAVRLDFLPSGNAMARVVDVGEGAPVITHHQRLYYITPTIVGDSYIKPRLDCAAVVLRLSGRQKSSIPLHTNGVTSLD